MRTSASVVLGVVVVLVVGSASACDNELPAPGQVVVYIDTDAILPEGGGQKADPSSLSPLVDRARIEVLAGGKLLTNATRDVPIDAAMLRARGLSFGIVPVAVASSNPGDANNGAITVRVRLFRADRLFEAEPSLGVTMDTTFTLPDVPASGIVFATAVLKADDFGRRLGPVAASLGPPPTTSLVGTWRGGRRKQCTTAARPGEACVPGASFFFGNPQFRGRTAANDIYEERLVIMSPFFIDVSEVTVAEFRKAWPLAGQLEPLAKDAQNFCTWTPPAAGPSPEDEQRVLNCVSWDTARAYCVSLGKDLPSEAELELVSSGLGEEWAFPWGNDEPDCSAAVWGCAGIADSLVVAVKTGAGECRHQRVVPAPLPPGQGLSDKIGAGVLRNLGGDDVQDLGGNVAEWTRDAWARPTNSFWSALVPLVDPVNTTPSPEDEPTAHPTRGGDWATTALATRAGFRRSRKNDTREPSTGLRCTRADR